jgi:hypothetical protein
MVKRIGIIAASGESPKIDDWLPEQGGLETSMSREVFARESPRRVLENLRAEIR